MTVSSASQVSARMQKVATSVRDAQPAAVNAAAAALKSSVQSTSPSRLRNVGKGGSKLGVTVKITGGVDKPSAAVTATGPWQIIEYDTKAHGESSLGRIRGKGAARARRQRDLNIAFGVRGAFSGAKPLKLPDGGYRFAVKHPGTKGKLVFHKGVAIGTPRAVAIIKKLSVTAVQKGFSG